MEDATTSRFERVEFAIRRRRLSESMKVDSSRDDSLVLTHCFLDGTNESSARGDGRDNNNSPSVSSNDELVDSS